MSDEIKYKNNPLNGVSLKKLLEELSGHYGFDILFAYLNINCFKTNASVESSVKFLKKTEWAREKVEGFYMYEYKHYPRASSQQFKLSPRDRIVPDDQSGGEPVELSLEDAARLQKKRAAKAAEFNNNKGKPRFGGGKQFSGSSKKPFKKHSAYDAPQKEQQSPASDSDDPWSNWKK